MDKRFAQVDDRFERLEKKVDEGFKENYDAHQEIIGAIDEICDRKIKKHCEEKHTFATS